MRKIWPSLWVLSEEQLHHHVILIVGLCGWTWHILCLFMHMQGKQLLVQNLTWLGSVCDFYQEWWHWHAMSAVQTVRFFFFFFFLMILWCLQAFLCYIQVSHSCWLWLQQWYCSLVYILAKARGRKCRIFSICTSLVVCDSKLAVGLCAVDICVIGELYTTQLFHVYARVLFTWSPRGSVFKPKRWSKSR